MNENINIENAIISTFLFDPEVFYQWRNKITKDDFSSTFLGNTFGVFQSLADDEKPISDDFIIPELKKRNQWIELSWLDMTSANCISNIDAYVQKIKNTKARNSLSQALSNASKIEGVEDKINYIQDVIDNTKSYTKPLFELIPASKVIATETDWIGTNWLPIPKRAVTLLTAKGGTGKSFVALQALLRYLNENGSKKAFAWLSEDPIGVSVTRARNICFDLGYSTGILDRLMLIGSETEVPHLYNSDGVASAFTQMKQLLKEFEFVVIDPLIAFYGEDENSNSHARAFMNAFTAWVNKEDKAVILIHHSKKGDDDQGSRGAGAFVDASRLTYSLSREAYNVADPKTPKTPKPQCLFVSVGKDNYNAKKHLTSETVQRKVFPFELELPLTSNSESTNKDLKW